MIQIHVGKQHTFGADINDSGQVRKTVSCDKCHVSQVVSRDGVPCHVSRDGVTCHVSRGSLAGRDQPPHGADGPHGAALAGQQRLHVLLRCSGEGDRLSPNTAGDRSS